MDESVPAPATQDENAAPEETAAEQKQPRRERWRRRVSTSVLVTVLLATLSVWIASAFTRQWDDRQKARVLQANIADQIGIAAAQTAGGLVALVESNRGPQDVQRFQQQGLLNQLRIYARLRAYYPGSRVLRVWSDYVKLVEGLTTMALTVSDPDVSPRARRESVARIAANLHRHVTPYLMDIYRSGFENPPNRTEALPRWVSDAIVLSGGSVFGRHSHADGLGGTTAGFQHDPP